MKEDNYYLKNQSNLIAKSVNQHSHDYFWTVLYLLTHLRINSYYIMNNSSSLKYILMAYWTLETYKYTCEVYTSAAEKYFDQYFLEDRMNSSVIEKGGKKRIIRSSVAYREVKREVFCSINIVIF